MKDAIIITSTNSIEGKEIKKYLGIVKAHCTAGIGFFGDFAAGLTDIFGGRSGTFEKNMQLIDNTAIESIKEQAVELDADAIIGIHIDNDEISGKGSQMLMVTVYGTAVQLSCSNDLKKFDNKKSVSVNTIRKAEKKYNIVSKVKDKKFELDSSEWTFVYEEKMQEIAQEVLENIIYWNSISYESGSSKLEKAKEYFKIMSDNCKDILYIAIKKYPQIFSILKDIIESGDICDYKKINQLLADNDIKYHKEILELIKANKRTYSNEDIFEIKELIETIKTTFQVTSKVIEEKSFLSNTIQKKWLCNCGEKNNIDEVLCRKCYKDQYGFERYVLSKDESIKILERKIRVIEENII